MLKIKSLNVKITISEAKASHYMLQLTVNHEHVITLLVVFYFFDIHLLTVELNAEVIPHSG